MQAFAANRSVLVATTVIEVGVDVPNATVMVVERAEPRALAAPSAAAASAGASRSYCVLMVDDAVGSTMRAARIMEETSDGFKIAERDLESAARARFRPQRHGLSDLQFLSVAERSGPARRRSRRGASALARTRWDGACEILDGLGGSWAEARLAQVG
jgi:RecG-like helicase